MDEASGDSEVGATQPNEGRSGIEGPSSASRAVEAAHRKEWARVLATVIRVTRDVEAAEDCVQAAYAEALVAWAREGVPARPGGWLTTVAVRTALQERRRHANLRRKLPLLVVEGGDDLTSAGALLGDLEALPDDRPRLIFMCCHPQLKAEARVALALRLLCGLTTDAVAASFLVKTTTMQARLTRAKKRVVELGLKYEVPDRCEMASRVQSVLDTLMLMYNAGYVAHDHAELMRADLCESAIELLRLVHQVMPGDPEVQSALALLLLTDARRVSRQRPTEGLVLLEDQDRQTWNVDLIREGCDLLESALVSGASSRFAVMASIAAVHDQSPSWEATDWAQISALYDVMSLRWPSPVVGLNRAIAVSFALGVEEGLLALKAVEDNPALAHYHYLPAARADMHRRRGDRVRARQDYLAAMHLATNAAERQFLDKRLRGLDAQ